VHARPGQTRPDRASSRPCTYRIDASCTVVWDRLTAREEQNFQFDQPRWSTQLKRSSRSQWTETASHVKTYSCPCGTVLLPAHRAAIASPPGKMCWRPSHRSWPSLTKTATVRTVPESLPVAPSRSQSLPVAPSRSQSLPVAPSLPRRLVTHAHRPTRPPTLQRGRTTSVRSWSSRSCRRSHRVCRGTASRRGGESLPRRVPRRGSLRKRLRVRCLRP